MKKIILSICAINFFTVSLFADNHKCPWVWLTGHWKVEDKYNKTEVVWKKVKNGEGKCILKKLLHRYIPKELIDRPKMGFVFPWDKWMRNELKDFCAEKIFSLPSRIPYMKESRLHKNWRKYLAGDKNFNSAMMWNLVVLSHWLEKHDING